MMWPLSFQNVQLMENAIYTVPYRLAMFYCFVLVLGKPTISLPNPCESDANKAQFCLTDLNYLIVCIVS